MIKSVNYLPKPLDNFMIQWHITERCNLSCKHCYQDNSYLNNELDFDGLCKILNQYIVLLKLWKVTGGIHVTGGEPFIRKDFFQLLEKFHENRSLFYYLIMTNGLFINKKTVRKLKEFPPRTIQISLEGMQETNDSIRGKGTFKRITKSLKLLSKENIHTIVSFTSNKKNYKDYPELIKLCEKIGVDYVWSDRMIACGKGAEIKSQMLEPCEVREFYKGVHKISEYMKRQKSKTGIGMHRGLYFLLTGDSSYICHAGKNFLIVMPNGDVFPCRRMPIKVGNAMERSLTEIWYSNNFLWKFRNVNNIPPICSSCKHWDNCFGGSRCVTNSYFGTPFAPDPQCWLAFKKLPNENDKSLVLKKESKDIKIDERAIQIQDNSPPIKEYLEIKNGKFYYTTPSKTYELEPPTKNKLAKTESGNRFIVLNSLDMDLNKLANELTENKPEVVLISLRIQDASSQKIEMLTRFLHHLKEKKINFKLTRPIPQCILKSHYHMFVKNFGMPQSCRECLELFMLDNDNIRLCKKADASGPHLKYMASRNQIHEYFSLFEASEQNPICKKCSHSMRKSCYGNCPD